MRRRLVLSAWLIASVAACAGRTVPLPSGDGAPLPDYAGAWRQAARQCGEPDTFSAELSLSGRAGRQRLRGHLLIGLASPGRIRLEGAAPFGPPIFVLVADGADTTLLLPRDNRVLRGSPPSDILAALVGLDLGPSDLLAILSGCIVPNASAEGGRLYDSGWARIDFAGGASAYLRREGKAGWRARAGSRPGVGIEYEMGEDAEPAAVRLRTDPSRGPVSDIRIALSQVAIGQAFGAGVFSVRVPADASPISLAELREAGPLGEKR
jgi:hypothetical protein